jgi:Na+-translocating ferredoxin:NAD+ oxidoreductase RnfG subunit
MRALILKHKGLNQDFEEEGIMEMLVDDIKLKNLMKQAIMEAIEEKKGVVHDLLVEVMEDVAMIRAIQEGEDSGYVGRDEIFGILSGSEGPT